jgi:hypothetical protein
MNGAFLSLPSDSLGEFGSTFTLLICLVWRSSHFRHLAREPGEKS